MKDSCDRTISSKCSSKSSTGSPIRIRGPICSEAGPSSSKLHKSSVWSGFLVSAFSIFNSSSEPKCGQKKISNARNNGWTSTVKRVINSGSMRRILGLNRTGVFDSRSDIWLLGICYKVGQEDSSTDCTQSEGFSAFVEDFTSRILITYRKGFTPIEDSKYTSDVNWGCMLRSSQMLVAQSFLVLQLGRSWRRRLDKPLEQKYVDILHLFGDSEESAYSIHNLLSVGKAYGLAPGSWVGPYAMCRTWEMLARCKREETEDGGLLSLMAVYVVSGDEDGERGGAPLLCIDDICRHCHEYSTNKCDWTPILLLVPLVLGLDKVNPRYLPLLRATFSFPQSIGVLGGRPGASTYIVGVQDEKAFYLDPHEVQPVVDITRDNLEIDTSSYHCSVVRHLLLDTIDPSLAIGFFCKDKNDFDDFCLRASELADQSDGAPLFTITKTRNSPISIGHAEIGPNNAGSQGHGAFDVVATDQSGSHAQEDDWQLL